MNVKQIIAQVNSLAQANGQPDLLTYEESELESDSTSLNSNVTVYKGGTARSTMTYDNGLSIQTKRAIKRRLAGHALAKLIYELLTPNG